jgi:hypothetical protein
MNDSIWHWYVLRNIKITFKTITQPGEIPGQTKHCRAPSPDMPKRRDSGSVKSYGNTTAGINDCISKLRCLCCSLQWRGGIFICTSWPAAPGNPTMRWMVELWPRRRKARWAYLHFLFPIQILLQMPAIHTEVSCGFLHSCQANAGVVTQIRPWLHADTFIRIPWLLDILPVHSVYSQSELLTVTFIKP